MSETVIGTSPAALLQEKAAAVVAAAIARGIKLVTAESCTAGRLVAMLADAPNASQAVFGGYVVYTKDAKERLGVGRDALDRYGAVSAPVARLLAECALAHSGADVAVAVTGVAGPTSDDDGNPVGLVYISASRRGFPPRSLRLEYGAMHRDAVLFNAIQDALGIAQSMVDEPAVAAGQGRSLS
jgi:nicotinamide-nucleotide amidase